MAKIPFETRAVIVVAQQLKYRDDANPDVGMGMSFGYFVDQAAELLELAGYQFDRELAISVLNLNAMTRR